MCRVYLLFTRLTLTSALWRMLGIQGGGHFSKQASKHNIFRRDAVVDRSERLLGKCRVLTRRNSAGLRIFHWGHLHLLNMAAFHTIQDEIFSNILASKIPPIHLGTPSSLFWWDATFCRFPSFKLQDINKSLLLSNVFFSHTYLCVGSGSFLCQVKRKEMFSYWIPLSWIFDKLDFYKQFQRA